MYAFVANSAIGNTDLLGECVCGPEITRAFYRYLLRAIPILNGVDSSLTGPIDGAQTLNRIGMDIDFWYRGSTPGCAIPPCDRTVSFCGLCVRDTVPNNVLYGVVAKALGVPQAVAVAGAQYADREHDEGSEQEGAYDIGYDLWRWAHDPSSPISLGSMCAEVFESHIYFPIWSLTGYDSSDAISVSFEHCSRCRADPLDVSDVTRRGIGFKMGDINTN